MTCRRTFINQISLTAGALLLRPVMAGATGSNTPPSPTTDKTITLVHISGLEGQRLPFTASHALAGLGGLANVNAAVKAIRAHTGDSVFIQTGNLTGHRCDLQDCAAYYGAVSALHPDIVVPGPYDYRHGEEAFYQLASHNHMPILEAPTPEAYDVNILPHRIVNKGGLLIGVFEAGSQPSVAGALNKTAQWLKEKKCRLVVCVMSGTAGECSAAVALSEAIDAVLMATETTVLHTTRILRNRHGEEVVLSQAGPGGAVINRLQLAVSAEGTTAFVASTAVLTGATHENYAAILGRYCQSCA